MSVCGRNNKKKDTQARCPYVLFLIRPVREFHLESAVQEPVISILIRVQSTIGPCPIHDVVPIAVNAAVRMLITT